MWILRRRVAVKPRAPASERPVHAPVRPRKRPDDPFRAACRASSGSPASVLPCRGDGARHDPGRDCRDPEPRSSGGAARVRKFLEQGPGRPDGPQSEDRRARGRAAQAAHALSGLQAAPGAAQPPHNPWLIPAFCLVRRITPLLRWRVGSGLNGRPKQAPCLCLPKV